jgi:hypothetical protein
MEWKKTNRRKALSRAISQYLALKLVPDYSFMEPDFLQAQYRSADTRAKNNAERFSFPFNKLQ